MQRALRTMIAATAAAAAFFLVATAAPAQQVGAPPPVKQIKLTEKQVLGFVAAQKDMAAVMEKIQGEVSDQLPPAIQAELDALSRKHGFKDFSEYDEVVANIAMVMSGIDPKTKVFTEPAVAIKKEIEDARADRTMSEQDRKQLLEDLNEALKSAEPIQNPGNIELVKKYYDKIDAALTQ